MKLKCIIIDDEPVARKILQEFVGEIDYLELVGQAENPLKATTLLNDHAIDVIFLDINMPKINGIDFLKSSKTSASVIMTTAYAEYAVEAFGLDVLDYLVKPIAFNRFVKACNKAKEISGMKKTTLNPPDTTDDHFIFYNFTNHFIPQVLTNCNLFISNIQYISFNAGNLISINDI